MPLSSKLSPEQWAEARRLRVGGATCADIARRFGVSTSTIGTRAWREGWSAPGSEIAAHSKTPAGSPVADIRSRLMLRLCRVIDCKIKIMELRVYRQLQVHLQADADGADADLPPPPGKDERDAFAALIASVNQVTEMASEPTPAKQRRRKAATGPVNPELTALSADIDLDGLAIASEKDQHRRELAEHLGKLFPKS